MDDRGTAARERLLDAATEIAGTLGRDALTADRLLTRAAVSEAEFHAQFPDVRSCLLAAHDRWLDRAESGLETGVASGKGSGTEVERLLESGLDVLLTCLAERPEVARLCLVEVPATTPLARERTVDRLQTALARRATQVGARFATPIAPRVAAGGIYDTVQRAAHAGETEDLRHLGPELARVWAPVLSGSARPGPAH